MSGPVAQRLGDRLHLQHGPIDLIIGADGAREAAFAAAEARFQWVLQELVDELPALRRPMGPDVGLPEGAVARRMDAATRPHQGVFVTRMAAVAGAVADTVLEAMRAVPLERAYVNNGGDIAIFLAPGARFSMQIAGLDGAELARISVGAGDGIGGIATSGRGGRSLSMGIADSVTVLAQNAATADVAATLIANAVDLPGHPAIARCPAQGLQPDSDLCDREVVSDVGLLSIAEIEAALAAGVDCTKKMKNAGQIIASALFLRGQFRVVGAGCLVISDQFKEVEHA